MTMTFSLHESIDPNAAFERFDLHSPSPRRTGEFSRDGFHILREKLKVPETNGLIERPRLNALLAKSVEQFPATLITGRSGTGKTAIAAIFAAQIQNVSWYTIESTDIEWPVFSRYFSECLSETAYGRPNRKVLDLHEKEVTQAEIARFLINRFSNSYAGPEVRESLIVLDDIHHIFDATWFEDFFSLLLHSLPPDNHLILLCRSKPPGPLWRLRSKQMLNVLDEKVISFNLSETESLFNRLGLKGADAERAQRQSFGRISKLLQSAGNDSTILPPSSSNG